MADKEQSGVDSLGRPTKRTEERAKIICEKIEQGMLQKDAAVLSGIDEATFYRWKKDDASFASRIEASLLTYKEKLIQVVNVSTVRDGKLALEVLARRWPDEYSSRQKIEVIDPQTEYKRMMKRINGLPEDATDEELAEVQEDS